MNGVLVDDPSVPFNDHITISGVADINTSFDAKKACLDAGSIRLIPHIIPYHHPMIPYHRRHG